MSHILSSSLRTFSLKNSTGPSINSQFMRAVLEIDPQQVRLGYKTPHHSPNTSRFHPLSQPVTPALLSAERYAIPTPPFCFLDIPNSLLPRIHSASSVTALVDTRVSKYCTKMSKKRWVYQRPVTTSIIFIRNIPGRSLWFVELGTSTLPIHAQPPQPVAGRVQHQR